MHALGWIALALLTLMAGNAFFVVGEIGLVASRRTRLQQRAESGDAKARRALEWIQKPGRFLATVQVGITLIGILEGVISDRAAALLDVKIRGWPHSKLLALIAVFFLVTYLQVVLGELLPKSLALRQPESVARTLAGPMKKLSRVAGWLVAFLTFSTEALLRLGGVKPAPEPAPVTEEEIAVMLAQGAKAGVFAASQQDMMESVIEMGERRITSIMTARPDIVWLAAEATTEDVRATVAKAAHSRYPVCLGSFDQVLGVVHTKDLFARRLAGEALDLKSLAVKVPTIPDSVNVLKALEAFRASGRTMAFVSDEYGSILGLVTLDDVLRNILGDMAADFADGGDADAVRRSDGAWLIDGIKPIEEFKDLLALESLPGEDEGAYQTLGGFVMARLGRIPKTGDVFNAGDCRYEVLKMDGRRVDKVLVKPKTPPAEKSAGTTA